MTVPYDVVALLSGAPAIGETEQAFPFVTVDPAGFPHSALLSRAELDVSPLQHEVLAVVASPRTRANLERDGHALLIAVEGTTAHYMKLQVLRSFTDGELLACGFGVVEHKRDSIGIPLSPITYRTTAAVASDEKWESSARVLAALTRSGSDGPEAQAGDR